MCGLLELLTGWIFPADPEVVPQQQVVPPQQVIPQQQVVTTPPPASTTALNENYFHILQRTMEEQDIRYMHWQQAQGQLYNHNRHSQHEVYEPAELFVVDDHVPNHGHGNGRDLGYDYDRGYSRDHGYVRDRG